MKLLNNVSLKIAVIGLVVTSAFPVADFPVDPLKNEGESAQGAGKGKKALRKRNKSRFRRAVVAIGSLVALSAGALMWKYGSLKNRYFLGFKATESDLTKAIEEGCSKRVISKLINNGASATGDHLTQVIEKTCINNRVDNDVFGLLIKNSDQVTEQHLKEAAANRYCSSEVVLLLLEVLYPNIQNRLDKAIEYGCCQRIIQVLAQHNDARVTGDHVISSIHDNPLAVYYISVLIDELIRKGGVVTKEHLIEALKKGPDNFDNAKTLFIYINEALVKLLIKKGAPIDGDCLTEAINHSSSDVIAFLLNHPNANISVTSDHLMSAIQSHHRNKLVPLLIEKGAKPDSSHVMQVLAKIIRFSDKKELISLLIEKGVQPNDSHVEQVVLDDYVDWRSLELLVQNGAPVNNQHIENLHDKIWPENRTNLSMNKLGKLVVLLEKNNHLLDVCSEKALEEISGDTADSLGFGARLQLLSIIELAGRWSEIEEVKTDDAKVRVVHCLNSNFRTCDKDFLCLIPRFIDQMNRLEEGGATWIGENITREHVEKMFCAAALCEDTQALSKLLELFEDPEDTHGIRGIRNRIIDENGTVVGRALWRNGESIEISDSIIQCLKGE